VSDEFGIQYPQARADLKLLEELYGLHTYRRGRTKVWKMPGVDSQRAVVGTAAALELGAIALDVFRNTPYGQYIDDLAQEWKQRAGAPHDERFRRLSLALVLRRTWAPTDRRTLLEVLETLLDCITLKKGVVIDYERSDDEIRRYELIPRRLIWYQGRLWLQAIDGDDEKLFDVAGILTANGRKRKALVADRVRPALKAWKKEQEERPDNEAVAARRQELREAFGAEVDGLFEYGERAEEDAYFAQAFGIFARNFPVEKVSLRVTGPWAKYLRRYRLHESQQNQEIDGGLRVRFKLGLCPEFRSFILGMIPDVVVEEPTSFAEELRRRAGEFAQRTE
jgi:predicted DNA-binding transcriptional regulator YafY